jgi:glycerol-3-phosphate dehydrogenase (NAD(P)+)
MSEAVAVLGAGNMGTAIAQVVATNGHNVRLWSIEHDVLEEVRDKHLNTRYLDDVRLHDNIDAVWDMAEAVQGAKLIVISVPSQVVRAVANDLAPHVQAGQLVLNVGKGLEASSHNRMSEVIVSELGEASAPFVGSMGGPAIAIEMARAEPMAVIVGLPTTESAGAVQEMLQNNHLKVQATDDVVGLELCSTLKNIYAIAMGITDGQRMGTNTKAFITSVSLDEMARIATLLGGQSQTVYGLAGLGDLITTGFSTHSRNRTLGDKLGAQSDWRQFIRTHTVEGVTAVRSMTELTNGWEGLPLLAMLNQVLFHDEPAIAGMRRFLESFSYA